MMNFLTPPIFDDEDKTMAAHHLFIIVWTFMAVGWLAILIAIIDPETVYRWLLIIGIIESTGLILLALNKYGHTRLVSNLLIFSVWAVATGMALTGGGTSSNAMAIYLIIVLIAGLVLSGRAGMVTAVLCSLTGLFLVYLEYSGALPVNRVSHTPLTLWIANTIYMAIIISLQYLISRTIKSALKQSRQELKERQRVEIALKMAKNNLDNVINFTGYPVFVKDDSFRFTLVNDALCDMLGMERKDIIGKTLGESLPKDQMDHFLKVDRMVLESGVENQCEELLTGRGGKILDIITKKTPYVDEQGNKFIVGVIHDITDRKRMEEELREMSLRDLLTGLHNRRGFFTLAEQQVKAATRAKMTLSLTYFDCDDFKWINDSLGHEQGDRVLIDTAHILRQTFRESDIIARIGGDEFVVLSIEAADVNPEVFLKRLQQNIDEYNAKETRRYKFALSWGTVVYDPKSLESLDELLSQADRLMYMHKKDKTNKQS